MVETIPGVSDKKVAVFAADFHLLKKPGMWGSRSDIAGDDVFGLKQVIDIVRRYDADLYIGGDIIDSVSTLPRPIVIANELLSPLINEGHKVRYIQGQHELVVQAHYDNYPWLSLVRGTEHISGKSFDFLGKRAFGLDYFPEAFEAYHLSMIPDDTEVLFMHGTASEIFPLGAHFSMSNIPEHVKYIFAGDYHVACEHTDENGRCIMYPGSTWLKSTSEDAVKSAIVCRKVEDGSFVWEREPIKSRIIVRYSELPENVIESGEIPIDTSLPEELQKPLIIVDELVDPAEYERLAVDNHLYTSSVKSASAEYDRGFDFADIESDEEILCRYADKQQHPNEFAFTLDVIQNSTVDALARLREKLGIEDSDLSIQSANEVAPSVPLEAGDINLDGE